MTPRFEARESRDALVHHNQVVWSALQKVQQGDLEGAQSVLHAAPGPSPSLGEVFRLYQEELETQAQQLRDSQERAEQALGWFAQLFRHLPVAALMVDSRGLVVDANEQARVDLGLAQLERAAPVPLRRLMDDADGELRLADALAVTCPPEGVVLDRLALRVPSGQRRAADLRISRLPARHSPHEQPMVLCVLHDRTAELDAQRAREATAQAERARDIAQASALAKSAMMQRLSHELRTPLNAVIGFSHLLLQGREPMSSQHRQRLGLIQEAGRNLLELVDDVLLLNRVGSGALVVHLQPVPLQALVDDVLALMQPQIQARGLRVDGLPPPSGGPPVEALADPRRLREILVNLVSNGVKYNRKGGVLRVQCHRRGDCSMVAISDTGIGLTPQQQEHLFEPFNRLGAETGPVEGTGLGLNIARSLAQAMGGDIQVQSVPGEGSTFSLVLPTPDSPAVALDPAADSSSHAQPA